MTEESFDPNEQCQQESNAGGTELTVAFGGPMCQTCMNEQFTGNGCKSFVKRSTKRSTRFLIFVMFCNLFCNLPLILTLVATSSL